MGFIKNHPAMTVFAVLAVAAIIGIIGTISYVGGVRDEGIKKETALLTTYKTGQANLSTYTNTIIESMGVADAGTEAADTIISNAIKGRYDGNMEPGTGGSMFSAISEAYPDVTANMKQYEKVQTQIEAGRASFEGKQKQMSSQLEDYKNWRDMGLFKSQVVKFLGFPSEDRLAVTVGNETFRGHAALDKMDQVIVSSEARQSYETGVSDPLVGGDKK